MDGPEQDVQSKNPTELLQEQVLLLRQVSASLDNLQDMQSQTLESLAGLSALNQRPAAEAMDVYVSKHQHALLGDGGLHHQMEHRSHPGRHFDAHHRCSGLGRARRLIRRSPVGSGHTTRSLSSAFRLEHG